MDEAFRKLLAEDTRYPREAYLFVFEALRFAQARFGSSETSSKEDGVDDKNDSSPKMSRKEILSKDNSSSADDSSTERSSHHVTGQQLCESVRRFALEEYGLLARRVLDGWGIRSTHDLGEIVYHLIQIGWMSKTSSDRLEDFDNVFDFDTEFLTFFRF